MTTAKQAFGSPVRPTEIRLKKEEKTLEVDFEDGKQYAFPAELLRVESPSAEVQGHSPDEKKTIGGKKNVAIIEVHSVGHYAVRLVFDDLHDSGIYSWSFLRNLGENQDRIWQDYLEALQSQGLSREPA